ncbi:MAG TPA: hypothetical protein PK668_09365 [Myxococcota bacterium]|nr:hypothetical protein [Myxococcota bacterium]HRY92810.1 hypothetical protein [Myxococcota bacterium]
MRAYAGMCLGLALIAGLGLGCAKKARPPRAVQPRVDIQEKDVREILTNIGRFRGWQADTVPTAAMLSPDEFTTAFNRNLRSTCKEARKRLEDRQIDPASRDLPEDCDALEVERPEKYEILAAGFYDDDADAVWLLDIACLIESWGQDVDQAAWREGRLSTLAHELFHHVQYQQHGTVLNEARALDPDEHRAIMALQEGDANVVGVIHAAQALGYDWGFRLQKMLHQSQTSSDQGNSYSGVSPPWVGGGQNYEEALAFGSYTAGMAFVVELYYRGGFATVDRAYRHLPRSTEQILHPDKYLAGELPVEVPAHVLPAGLETRRSARDGELYLRAVLSTCTGWLRACEMATGWAGDRWTWIREGGKTRALVWTQVWDREDDARKFFQPPRAEDRCLGEALSQFLLETIDEEEKGEEKDLKEEKPAPSAQAGESPPPTVVARMQGRKTGYVVGLPPEQAEPILEAFFAAPIVDPPPAPPPP